MEKGKNSPEKTIYSVKEFERHEENPFMQKALQDVEKHNVKRYRKVNSTGKLTKEAAHVVVNSDGEPVAYGAFMEYVELDEKQFAKVYIKEMSAFWKLTKAGQKVLMYILSNMKPNNDMVMFSHEKCMEYTGYKHKKNVVIGLADLIKKELVAKSIYEDVYFINPMIVFNGNRITFAKTYIKRQEKKKEQLMLFDENQTEEEQE